MVGTDAPDQYATDSNLRARQRLWANQRPAFDLVDWVLDLAGVTAGQTVLDLGCGNGRYLAALATASPALVVGCDISLGMLRAAPSRTLVAADAIALPFATASFDVVLAPHMLYHVTDRQAAVAEMRRVLRPGGCCVVVTNGEGHLASLRKLVDRAAQPFELGWKWTDRMSDAFSMENGQGQLATAFRDVRPVRPTAPARAVVHEAEVVAGYVNSVGDIYGGELAGRWPELVAAVRTAAAELIDRDGALIVEGDSGALVCR